MPVRVAAGAFVEGFEVADWLAESVAGSGVAVAEVEVDRLVFGRGRDPRVRSGFGGDWRDGGGFYGESHAEVDVAGEAEFW